MIFGQTALVCDIEMNSVKEWMMNEWIIFWSFKWKLTLTTSISIYPFIRIMHLNPIWLISRYTSSISYNDPPRIFGFRLKTFLGGNFWEVRGEDPGHPHQVHHRVRGQEAVRRKNSGDRRKGMGRKKDKERLFYK